MLDKAQEFITSLSNFIDSENQRLMEEVSINSVQLNCLHYLKNGANLQCHLQVHFQHYPGCCVLETNMGDIATIHHKYYLCHENVCLAICSLNILSSSNNDVHKVFCNI